MSEKDQDAELAESSVGPAGGHSEQSSGNASGTIAGGTRPLPSAKEIVRLIQCPVCRRPLQKALTLPCGGQICRLCIPKSSSDPERGSSRPQQPSHEGPEASSERSGAAAASNITIFTCPLRDGATMCTQRRHRVAECGLDVTVNKVLAIIGDALEPLLVAGRDSDYQATSAIAVVYMHALTKEKPPADIQPLTSADHSLLATLVPAMRAEVDCQVCYGILLEPLTTPCGHTFCRSCLTRVLDHSDSCPACRARLPRVYRLPRPEIDCGVNVLLSGLVSMFWPHEVRARKLWESSPMHGLAPAGADTVFGTGAPPDPEADTITVPIFVCTLSFPRMPTFLHIFEPRYRLMLRRCLDSDRRFGMVLPRSASSSNLDSDDAQQLPFFEIGTILRIVNVEFFHDGRSLIETVGVDRFRVTDYWMSDGGYVVGHVARYQDMDPVEERARAAVEVAEWRRANLAGDAAQLGVTSSVSATASVAAAAAPDEMMDGGGVSRATATTAGDGSPAAWSEVLSRHGGYSGHPHQARSSNEYRWALSPSRASAMTTAELLAFCAAYVQASQRSSTDGAPEDGDEEAQELQGNRQGQDGDTPLPAQTQTSSTSPRLPPGRPSSDTHQLGTTSASASTSETPATATATGQQPQQPPVSNSTGRVWLTPRLEAMYGRCPMSAAAAARLQRMCEQAEAEDTATAAARRARRTDERGGVDGEGSAGEGPGGEVEGDYDLEAAAAAAVVRQRVAEAAATFTWWFASVFPAMDEAGRYAMLCCRSRRERLKLCVAWIAVWVRRPRW